MKYQSTRDITRLYSSSQIIKQGISAEGGLFVPAYIPILSETTKKSMISMSYKERAVEILGLFLTDFSRDDIKRCVDSAYRDDNFDCPDVAPVKKLNDSLYILELWHGPTCAFKDMALQILPHFMTRALKKTGEKREVVILVATSGDTGKAALEGFKDVDGTHVVVFYPLDGVSTIQRLQMITQEGRNVCVVAVKGNFDDAQSGVKAIFTDNDIIRRMEEAGYLFSSANSINWGRLVPQIVYYVSAYLDMLKSGELSEDETFNVVVPTGNFGNILAAYYARCMGVPIHKLICASNRNRVLADFINTGVYDRRRELYKTISPSMDILISSNLERLLFELVDRDDKKVRELMNDLKTNGWYRLDGRYLERLQSVFWGGYATEEETLEAIRITYNEYNYVMDPHTAVGRWVYDCYVKETGDTRKTLLVSTASPFKFARDVLRGILGEVSVAGKDDFLLLDMLASVSGISIPAALSDLKNKKVLHHRECLPCDMGHVVGEIFNIE